MQAGTLCIKDIFQQERRYVVPLYQRPYVWQRGLQWEPLWDDIRNVAEKMALAGETRPHFLGAVVLDMQRRLPGQMVTSLVIDGQQRLTTIQILLESLCDLLGQLGQDKHHKALLKLTRNDDPMSDDPDDCFKVWPTNIDQEHYRLVMMAGSPHELLHEYSKPGNTKAVGNRIGDAYLYFYDEMKDWLGSVESEGFDERMNGLFNAIREEIRLVVIDLGAKDDAQMIFETLNARGTPLLPADLIKNDLFHLAKQDNSNPDKLYNKYWLEFDQDADYWRSLLGRGHAQRARIDTFFLYYLAAKIKDDVSPSHLYGAFRDYRATKEVNGAENLMQEIKSYSVEYRSIDSCMGTTTRQSEFLERVQQLEMLASYPFILELFHRFRGQDWLDAVVIALESYLVRRVLCQLSARNYNRFFVELLKELDGDPSTVSERIVSALNASDTESERWPSDQEFALAWRTLPAYSALKRARVIMVLKALEQELRTKFSESVEIHSDLSVEHIMPQSWYQHWPLPDGDPDEGHENRLKLIHTFGNLTLVTTKLNPSLSNSGWESKRAAMDEHSILRLNKELCCSETWGESSIEKRAVQLFDMAVRAWPAPVATS